LGESNFSHVIVVNLGTTAQDFAFNSHLYSIVIALSISFQRSWALSTPQWPSFHQTVFDSTCYIEMSKIIHDIIGGKKFLSSFALSISKRAEFDGENLLFLPAYFF
jgi:hypothetical protein